MASTSGTCPYLGLESDPSLRLSYADPGHRCFAFPNEEEIQPNIEHQGQFCLTGGHVDCPLYERAASAEGPAPDYPDERQHAGGRSPLRILLWGLVIVAAAAVILRLGPLIAGPEDSSPALVASNTATPTPEGSPAWPTPDPVFSPAAVVATPTPAPQAIARSLVEELPTPTLGPDEATLGVTPAAEGAGWVGSSEARGNHLGDSFLHTGYFQGEVFHGVLQFDLSRIPRGAPIRYAGLTLTGLDSDRLDRSANGVWQVRWLDPATNQDWSRATFQTIHNAVILQTILPAVDETDLGVLGVNRFEFDSAQRQALEQAIIDEQSLIAFRLDGPQSGADNVFSWDSGYGPTSRGNVPVLQIVTGPAPATPPPVPTQDYVVVTNTPTPENVLTVAVAMQTATMWARLVGEYTPTPRSWVTATPTPLNEATAQAERLLAGLPPIITPTPRPGNPATATMISRYATAEARTTGTPTPLPTGFITATPTPTWVVVTNTPTADNVQALLSLVIAEATRTATAGPPTPFPPGVVTATPTPTATPVPENAATAEAQVIMATIRALTTGTPTPTATPTATPRPSSTATPSATSSIQIAATAIITGSPSLASPSPEASAPLGATLESVQGKILFFSDRLGEPQVFAVDAGCVYQEGGCGNAGAIPLVQRDAYDAARDRDSLAANGYGRVIVQLNNQDVPQLFLQDYVYNDVVEITTFTGASYDPVWSPTGDRIAFVSAEPGNDEIYTISVDGSSPQRLTFDLQWDKHPTWSPDGNQILFYSNRDAGRSQLWIMDAGGSNQRNVSNNPYNDWDPVWVK